MAVLRNAITLRYAHDDNSAYLTCPVACLIRNAQGQWELGGFSTAFTFTHGKPLIDEFTERFGAPHPGQMPPFDGVATRK